MPILPAASSSARRGWAPRPRCASPATRGTDLTVRLADGVVAGSTGLATESGSIAHWPGGLVAAFPAAHAVNGTVVLAPGDLNLTFKRYVEHPVHLLIEDDHVVEVSGDGVDARPVPLVPVRLRRPRGPGHEPRRLGHEPGGALGLRCPVRQGRHQRHRGPRVRRQLPVLHRRQRACGPVHGRALRPAAARRTRSRWTGAWWSTPASWPTSCARSADSAHSSNSPRRPRRSRHASALHGFISEPQRASR